MKRIHLNCYILRQDPIYSNMKCPSRKYAVFSSMSFIAYWDAIFNHEAANLLGKRLKLLTPANCIIITLSGCNEFINSRYWFNKNNCINRDTNFITFFKCKKYLNALIFFKAPFQICIVINLYEINSRKWMKCAHFIMW